MSKLRLQLPWWSGLINTDTEIDLALLGFRYRRNRATVGGARLSGFVENQPGPIV